MTIPTLFYAFDIDENDSSNAGFRKVWTVHLYKAKLTCIYNWTNIYSYNIYSIDVDGSCNARTNLLATLVFYECINICRASCVCRVSQKNQRFLCKVQSPVFESKRIVFKIWLKSTNRAFGLSQIFSGKIFSEVLVAGSWLSISLLISWISIPPALSF